MKISKSKFIQIFLILCSFSFANPVHISLALASKPGVLILAHGSHDHENHHLNDWERTVLETAGEVSARIPGSLEVAFGMWDRDSFQESVDLLASEGIDELRVIPLYISSHSILNTIQRYQFGVLPGFSLPFLPGRIIFPSSIQRIGFADALDNSPELSDILIDRAKELRQSPENEELILVAHGPVTHAEDQLWLKDLSVHANRIQVAAIQELRPFADIHYQTVRDDSPPWIREKMTRKLRKTVQEILDRGNTPLILPVLLAPGGIETGILERLKGLHYRYTGKMLAPHPRLVDWLVRTATSGN